MLATLLACGSRADAACDATTCAQMSVHTMCEDITFACVRETCGNQKSNHPTPDLPPCMTAFCEQTTATIAPAGTACESDGLACTSDVCGSTTVGTVTSPSGQCTHVATPGGSECNGTCVQGCCASPNSCTGGGVCPANGGTCGCPPATKSCNGACIAESACCVDTDCPDDDATHLRGVCTAQGCVLTCASGYRACGATCIVSTQCCENADCASPPSGCYAAQGTCSSGMCSFAFADGNACDADGDACTPNDTCKSGTCVADTAHTVKCVQRECHGVPSCDKTSGNCVDVTYSNGAMCGGDSCAAAGTCTAGMCSMASKSCTQLDALCQAGVCDPSQPSATDCVAVDLPNGMACATTDKCIPMAHCSGGTCVGTPIVCTPSGPCRTSTCQSATGACEEDIAAPGTPCEDPASCRQNPTCDDSGTCSGDPLPDGTPCQLAGCEVAALCSGGQCVCLSRADFAIPTGDMGAGVTEKGHGCSATPGTPTPLPAIVFGLIALVATLTRRRV